jgi:hypothetical protein
VQLVGTLCYKPADRGFDSRRFHWGFSIYLIFPAALWPRGSTQLLTEMSARNLPGGRGKGWPARKADNLAAICEPIV